jgi:hypothetical protein
LSAIKKQPVQRSSGGRAVSAAPARGSAPRPAPESASVSETLPATAGNGAAGAGTEVTRDLLVQLWGDELLAALPNRARARFRVGRFVAVDAGTAVFALPNETHRSYCEDVRIDVETVLGAHFGLAVPLRLVVDDEADGGPPARPAAPRSGAGPTPEPEPVTEHDENQHDLLDPVVLAAQTELAGAGMSPEELLKQAFPGAEEV